MLPILLCNFANASKSMFKITRKGCDPVPTDDLNGSTDNCIVNPNGDLLTQAHESIHSENTPQAMPLRSPITDDTIFI